MFRQHLDAADELQMPEPIEVLRGLRKFVDDDEFVAQLQVEVMKPQVEGRLKEVWAGTRRLQVVQDGLPAWAIDYRQLAGAVVREFGRRAA